MSYGNAQKGKVTLGALSVAMLCTIVGCSQPTPVVEHEAAVAPPTPKVVRPPKASKPPRPTPKPTPQATPRPTPKPTPTPRLDSSTQSSASAVESPGEVPTEQKEGKRLVASTISSLVNKGTSESISDNQLVFVSNEPDGAGSPGLYEDAILLNRLRAALKASLPEANTFAEAVKVSAGVVTLQVPPGSDEKISASAVDTAFSQSGVKKVILNIP